MGNQNTETLEEAYRLWHDTKGESVSHWMSLMADNVDFSSLAHGRPGLEFTTHRVSKEEVGAYFDGLVSGFEMIHYTVDQFVTEGDTVVMIGSTAWRCRETGKEFDTPKVDVHRFKNGKIVGFYEYYDTAMVQHVTEKG